MKLSRIKLAVSRRIHPVDKMMFHLHTHFKSKRKLETAKKYEHLGKLIDASGDDHLHMYLTLRCNLSCYFCINEQFGEKVTFKEKSGTEWLSFLNRIYNIRKIYLQGGEPFMYKDIVEVINGLDNFNVVIYTNLPAQRMSEIVKIRPNNNNIIMLCSYHPLNDKRSVNQFVHDFNRIPKGIKKAVHIIDIPEVSCKLYARAFRRYNLFLERQDVSVTSEHYQIPQSGYKSVMCNSNMEVVSPDMNIYRCLGLMLKGINPVPLDQYTFNNTFERCDYYGLCGQCATAMELMIDEVNE